MNPLKSKIKYGSKGVTWPLGFQASGLACGIKKNKILDLGLLLSSPPSKGVGLFTQNAFKAAPIAASEKNLKKNPPIQAILVNSGNANACTGAQGETAVQQCQESLAKQLGMEEKNSLIFSTGSIGVPLPVPALIRHFPALISSLSKKSPNPFAKSILTTDKITKCRSAQFSKGNLTVKIGATAKGAGMIEPSMATMLCFITSDVSMPLPLMKAALKEAVFASFNRISVDGDMSTNDSVVLLCNGASHLRIQKKTDPAYALFLESLIQICRSLSEKIVFDGEGATKLLRVAVQKARTDKAADAICRSIANSLLLKSALFGEKPHWGRILSSIGAAGVSLNPSKVSVSLQGIKCFDRGEPLSGTEKKLIPLMKQKEIQIDVTLGEGSKEAFFLGSDLSPEYVKLNAT